MSWTKLEPIDPKIRDCLTCGTLVQELSMDEEISVGFGFANVTKDGEIIYDEAEAELSGGKIWTVQDAENEAAKDQNHDWRINLIGGMRGRVFQRHDVGKWVLVKENYGIA